MDDCYHNTEKQAQERIASLLGGTDDAHHDAIIINKFGILGLIWRINRAMTESNPLVESVSNWLDESLNLNEALIEKSLRYVKSYENFTRQNETLRAFYDALKEERGINLVPSSSLLSFKFSKDRNLITPRALSVIIKNDLHLKKIEKYVLDNAVTDPAHDEEHLLRVARWAIIIGADKLDHRQIIAAALLHDIVNMPKGHPNSWEASRLSADLAKKFLRAIKFGKESQLTNICQAIEEHSYSRGQNPKSYLGKALQDADRLDALGSIGIIRLFSVGTQMGVQPIHIKDPFAVHRNLDDKAFTLDHCFTKLLNLAATMKTQLGKEEAIIRTQLIKQFLCGVADSLGTSVSRAEKDRIMTANSLVGDCLLDLK